MLQVELPHQKTTQDCIIASRKNPHKNLKLGYLPEIESGKKLKGMAYGVNDEREKSCK